MSRTLTLYNASDQPVALAASVTVSPGGTAKLRLPAGLMLQPAPPTDLETERAQWLVEILGAGAPELVYWPRVRDLLVSRSVPSTGEVPERALRAAQQWGWVTAARPRGVAITGSPGQLVRLTAPGRTRYAELSGCEAPLSVWDRLEPHCADPTSVYLALAGRAALRQAGYQETVAEPLTFRDGGSLVYLRPCRVADQLDLDALAADPAPLYVVCANNKVRRSVSQRVAAWATQTGQCGYTATPLTLQQKDWYPVSPKLPHMRP
ncbi:MAG: hypothetical protein KKA73_16230 [Chloroflexi bacterium]|nr:hypothetical protein [Chloroflexota bacterium]